MLFSKCVQTFKPIYLNHNIKKLTANSRIRSSQNLRRATLSICAAKKSKFAAGVPVVFNRCGKENTHNCFQRINFSIPMSSSVKGADNMDSNRLVWIDLEMTGLDVEKERIIEIACLITEGDLTIVEKGPNLVIHQDNKFLDGMDEWCTLHHGQSGLTEAVRNSSISTEEAEAKVLSFVSQHVPPGKCPLAGNSVGTDKLFLERYMPKLAKHLHYRIVDVSTIKELCRRWYPEDFKKAPAKKLSHRAMDDIVESIEELKYYQAAVFKS
ncbi:hypothetical protein EGW08_022735 [Elysia chlorotica]|uniref:Exonuclease domain-containing protein n=1 Tax=Elysia chlorotica TaxID=188477 RepID=A0A433SK57_ELYCH|nr:hypothetical protein EGW08_022735 [Elysia chlorotica]